MLSDVEIMERVQAGDTGLFALLVERYQSRLLRFAKSKLENSSDAEDIVQDAFLAAYHARNSYSTDFAFSTWIWTITLNLARKVALKQSGEHKKQQAFASLPRDHQEVESPIELLLKSEQRERLDLWLHQIPENQSDAIRLKSFGGLGYQAIASAMDCSESGAKRRVKLGLLKLSLIAEND
ncbi:RNA polymerase sigma factor [Planctomicrobium sp.]|nr:RNA polymerase sigma factor [Planctomicrobium sp.]MDB4439593.1 RNA polymerase sigma factor [Planctomicrobium sp.]MDB4732864.1 RNA polymerase sigma factor [Planctomicrobium sp.]